MLSSSIGRLRAIALTEGVSFLVLLFVAMPLKYLGGLAMPVTVVGWIHGLLFVGLCLALLLAMPALRWSVKKAAMVFIASLVPFGPFLIDSRLRTIADRR